MDENFELFAEAAEANNEIGDALLDELRQLNARFARKFSNADEQRFRSCVFIGMYGMLRWKESQDQPKKEGEKDE